MNPTPESNLSKPEDDQAQPQVRLAHNDALGNPIHPYHPDDPAFAEVAQGAPTEEAPPLNDESVDLGEEADESTGLNETPETAFPEGQPFAGEHTLQTQQQARDNTEADKAAASEQSQAQLAAQRSQKAKAAKAD